METKEIQAEGRSLYFCSTDGKQWLGVDHPPANQQEEKTIESLIDGRAAIHPVTFNRSLIDALESDQSMRRVFAYGVEQKTSSKV
jgi:hypothetical protein